MKLKGLFSGWLGILTLALVLECVAIGLTLWIASALHLDLASLFSLGQLLVALLLIPLAVVAFWEARLALLRSVPKPLLRLAFLGEDGLLYEGYTLELPGTGAESKRVTVAVENKGDAIAVWWQVRFDIPLSLVKLIKLGNGQLNVFQRQLPMMMDTVGDVERRVAQSAGTAALFPGPPIQVAAIVAKIDPTFPHQFAEVYDIPFELLTDISQPVRGHLPLRVVKMPP